MYSRSASSPRQDHPRVCGEKCIFCTLQKLPLGSPPRVRGKEIWIKKAWANDRITPACAGKSGFRSSCCRRPWDHPRVCGEKWLSVLRIRPFLGSPPRVRGKVFYSPDSPSEAGITPACAGKRRTDSKATLPHEDHPRVCGEKAQWLFFAGFALGSPPRVRGKGLQQSQSTARHRITPACAGKSGF